MVNKEKIHAAKEFIESLYKIKNYWLSVEDTTKEYVAHGIIFSILVMIDGDSSDNDFHPLKIVDTDTGERIDCGYLHELFSSYGKGEK